MARCPSMPARNDSQAAARGEGLASRYEALARIAELIRSHSEEKVLFQTCASDLQTSEFPQPRAPQTLTVRRRETGCLTVASLLKTACPRTKRFPGTASGPSYILR